MFNLFFLQNLVSFVLSRKNLKWSHYHTTIEEEILNKIGYFICYFHVFEAIVFEYIEITLFPDFHTIYIITANMENICNLISQEECNIGRHDVKNVRIRSFYSLYFSAFELNK